MKKCVFARDSDLQNQHNLLLNEEDKKKALPDGRAFGSSVCD
jgi:hypothetical protein